MYAITGATGNTGKIISRPLAALDFEGNNHQDLHDQRDITCNEGAGIYGKVIGKPDLSYVYFSYDDCKKATMENRAASESAADHMKHFIQLIHGGKADFPQSTPQRTAPNSIEEFADTLITFLTTPDLV
jgi:hypothetical protein